MGTPQGPSSYDVGSTVSDDNDRLVTGTTYPVDQSVSPTLVGENTLTARNRIQWGPIFGGIVAALASFLLLTLLGFALGASVLEPRDSTQEISTWAAIWGAFSIIVAFFIGGWIAARTAAIAGDFAGLMQGMATGAAGLLFIIWLSASGLGNLFGTIGSSVGSIANVAANTVPAAQQATGVNVDDPQAVADQAGAVAQDATDQVGETLQDINTTETFENIRNGALGTFFALLLPLLAAMLGGWAGKYNREELVRGTGD